jgi:hypothetical protein
VRSVMGGGEEAAGPRAGGQGQSGHAGGQVVTPQPAGFGWAL